MSILGIWIIIVFKVAYPSHNAPTDNFGVIIYSIYTLFFALGLGTIILFVRAFSKLIRKTGFIYNFIGTFNVGLGLIGLTFAIIDVMENPWILLFAISFLIGISILSDIYYKKEKVKIV